MLSSDGIESNIADLEEAKPELRMLNEGYPCITENGALLHDPLGF